MEDMVEVDYLGAVEVLLHVADSDHVPQRTVTSSSIS
jgi:hypothetical protein